MKVVTQWLGDFPARQVCMFTGSMLILPITYVCIPRIPARKTRMPLGLGLAWLALTLVFEVCLGLLVLHRPWEDFLSDFDMLHGDMFSIGLAVLMLSPLIAARWREGSVGWGPRLLAEGSEIPRPLLRHASCPDGRQTRS